MDLWPSLHWISSHQLFDDDHDDDCDDHDGDDDCDDDDGDDDCDGDDDLNQLQCNTCTAGLSIAKNSATLYSRNALKSSRAAFKSTSLFLPTEFSIHINAFAGVFSDLQFLMSPFSWLTSDLDTIYQMYRRMSPSRHDICQILYTSRYPNIYHNHNHNRDISSPFI